MKYVVRQGHALGWPTGDILPGGEVPASLSAAEATRLLDLGVIVAYSPEVASQAQPPDSGQHRPPGTVPASQAKGSRKSKWDLDPDALRGLSVDQLNVMIRERDENFVVPFETVEECVAHLCADFKPPVRDLAGKETVRSSV